MLGGFKNRYAALAESDDESDGGNKKQLSAEVPPPVLAEEGRPKARKLLKRKGAVQSGAPKKRAKKAPVEVEQPDSHRDEGQKDADTAKHLGEGESACQDAAKNEGDATTAAASASSQQTISEKILPGGVTVKVLQPGAADAKSAKVGHEVSFHYEGWLPGKAMKRFDKGEVDFVVGDGSVVEGFDRGVRGMRIGERRRIFVPAKLGYGKKGKKPKVPPHSDLVFEVFLERTGLHLDGPPKSSAMSLSRREAARRQRKKQRRT
mmetsp:Transcript_68905/g.165392  ORF Transcript_68905/g.165392 Transcript_68905/m.165392 type:complete len:263 (-) Transcript_68905:41-829(-)